MTDITLPESEILEALELLLVRFEDGLIADNDVTAVIHEMVETAARSVDPPRWRAALADDTVSVIACPVDYSANSALIASLGELDESLS